MPLIYDELFTCPYCKAVFQTKILGYYDTFGAFYSDLYIASEKNPQPILHMINLCPKCGFTAYTADFLHMFFEKKDIINAIKKTEFFSGRKATQFNAGDGYLVIAEYSLKQTLEQKSFTLMQASYAYRDLKDPHLNKCRNLVLNSIYEILNRKEFHDNPEEVYLYLAGELNRLLNNQNKSLEYFKKALTIAEKNSLISIITIHQLSTPSDILPRKFFSKK